MRAPAQLTGPELIELRDILVRAFTLDELDDFLLCHFDRSRTEIVGDGGLKGVMREILIHFNHRCEIPELLRNARLVRPRNTALIVFIHRVGGDPGLPLDPTVGLERIVRQTNSMLDVGVWVRRLAELQNQVCRIEVPAAGGGWQYGSGFLVGPDVVLTNHHVLEPVIEGSSSPDGVVLRFDYALLDDGHTPNPGTVFGLADDWLLDSSPPSEADFDMALARGADRAELDYAFLRVDDEAGRGPVGGGLNRMSTHEERGWVDSGGAVLDVAPGSQLAILQHPQGSALKLALDTEAVIGVNETTTRLLYRTNTEPGSSGSPCFDANWRLVALHQAGDPNYRPAARPTFNQGVPVVKILDLLRERDKRDLLMRLGVQDKSAGQHTHRSER